MLTNLGSALNALGHKSFYAVDSPQNLWRFSEYVPEGPHRVFSEYFAKQDESSSTCDFPWTAFFPDFDRYEIFGVNRNAGQGYYLRLAAALDSFFEQCMRDWKIDIVVYEGVNNSFAWFANRAAQRNGAKYVGVEESRLPGRYDMHGGSIDIFSQVVKECYQRIESGEDCDPDTARWADKYLESFGSATPDYMASNGLLLENPLSKYAKGTHARTFWRLASYQLKYRSYGDRSYRSGPPLTYSLVNMQRNVMRWLRAKTLLRFFSPPQPDTEEYYLYPIHFHPEASTSVCSRWYVDEYPVIKNLAFSLPPGRWLYVKDHPSAVGYPPRSFYRSISEIPNVRLIAPGADTKALIAKSIGVITQTSTVGYEALVIGKPVWVLGRVFYDFHPRCRKIAWTDDLAASLANPPSASADSGRNLVIAYYRSSKPGALPLRGESEVTASYQQVAREIVDCPADFKGSETCDQSRNESSNKL